MLARSPANPKAEAEEGFGLERLASPIHHPPAASPAHCLASRVDPARPTVKPQGDAM
jgi:hypothetical protein